ncbi:MAG: phosphoribosylamine--glycine ligase [Bdellovibrionaceae bacterium]|nr:phosphoribosylamine--glycine ligase [Pseudobdellovibrionaceae bacterium]
MKVLVIGQGGREHAIVRALRLSPSVSAVHVLPGSDAIEREAVRHVVDWRDFEGVVRLVQTHGIELTVIGPDDPVAEGLADALRGAGCLVFGPSRAAAQLESSKLFAKRFMVDAGIPTARFHEVDSVATTMVAAQGYRPPYVLKADGLAAGKGVFICQDLPALENAARAIFETKVFGAAGAHALLEAFQTGYEISCLVLTNGQAWEPLVLAADHKRLRDHDIGPNTGGMGTVAPYQIDPALRERIQREVLAPTMKRLQETGLLYRGVLYVGLMITERGPSVLEFNARFGDPEAQVILPLLDGDWGEVFLAVARGEVPKLKWKPQAAACVVLAAEGYPDAPQKGVRIEGDLASEDANGYFLHAGTVRQGESWLTNGGRVLNSIGLGQDLRAAVARAYAQADRAQWPGQQRRSDIGSRVIAAAVQS